MLKKIADLLVLPQNIINYKTLQQEPTRKGYETIPSMDLKKSLLLYLELRIVYKCSYSSTAPTSGYVYYISF